AFGRLSLCALSVDFGVYLVKKTSDGHFLDSIESEMLFPLGRHIRFAFMELQMNFGGPFEL
ncbi:hypothetical protein HAX54_027364, partial [Datura stramonium]|nr:hypothetical protein [Datura stramonium]